MCRHEDAQIRKRRVDEREPQLVGEAAAAGLDGLGIPVDREQATLSTQGLEYACRMTAAPERRIDIVTTRLECQRRQRLIHEHRLVLVLALFHRIEAVRPRPSEFKVVAGRAPLARALVSPRSNRHKDSV